MIRRSLILLPLALAAAIPAPAQTAQTAPAGDVVVVGKSRAEVDRQARLFVESIVPRSPSDVPMARFDVDTVCPRAIGLTPAFDGAITQRLRQVAAAASAPLAKPDCRTPNALVLFTDDIAPTVDMLERRYVGMFVDEYGMPLHVAKRGPVVVWHLGALVNANGEVLNREENGGLLVNRTSRAPSRIEASVHRSFGLTVVLIERRSVEGLTVTQVADYAAMRTLADTRPPRGDGAAERPATILSAIDAPMGSAVPVSLTSWDLGFLRGLYSRSPTLTSTFQRGEVASAITHNVMGAPAATTR